MDMKHKNIIFWIALIASIVLLVASFFAPPVGVISSSVLTAVGELFAFAALGLLPSVISEGRTARIQRGDTSVTIGSAFQPYELPFDDDKEIKEN